MNPDGDRWTTFVTRVLAPNPSLMTLDGTNSLVLRAPASDTVIVVDPGPDDAAHLDRLASFGPVDLVLLTHHHSDHVEAAASFAARTGAPVRAVGLELCIDAEPLRDGERIRAAGIDVDVLATPGHTADSVCLHLIDDDVDAAASRGSMVTGDTILGRGTTIIAQPDGSLADYLASLDRLERFGAIAVLPAHGRLRPDLAAVCAEYRDHRLSRLAEIRGVLDRLGLPAAADPETVGAVVDSVYGEVDPGVRFAAEASAHAQLEYLAAHA